MRFRAVLRAAVVPDSIRARSVVLAFWSGVRGSFSQADTLS